jgi:hypothetical protein
MVATPSFVAEEVMQIDPEVVLKPENRLPVKTRGGQE